VLTPNHPSISRSKQAIHSHVHLRSKQLMHAWQILAETIEDLVDGSPGSLAFDGSLLLGAKDTTLYVLDAKTGGLVEEVAAIGGRLLQVAAILGEACTKRTIESLLKFHQNAVLAGRKYGTCGGGGRGN